MKDAGGTAAVIATVGGEPITVGEVDARVEACRRSPAGAALAAPGTPEAERLRRLVAHALIDEAVVRLEARALRPTGTGEVENDAQLVFRCVTAAVEVAEATLHRYYHANVERFTQPDQRRVRHVLVDDETAARALAERVRQGAELGSLALSRSQDRGSRHRGGDLGWVARGELSGPLEDAVFAAETSDVVGPVRSCFGWHVLRVEAIRAGGSVPFEGVRAAIERELLEVARREEFERWLARRRRSVWVSDPWHHPGDPRSEHHTHRH